MVGIPEYRLPREIVKKEIAAIESMGVQIRTGVLVGKDISFDTLRSEGFEAFFLGIGAHRGFRLEIEGEEDFSQVHCAIALLRRDNLEGRKKPAEKVVVVGGGNSAMDAARTCVRLGCKEVHVAYRRTRQEMPANPQEIEEAMEEGVQFHFLAVPVKVGGEGGLVTYLECLQARLGEPDASGRRRPIPVDGSNFKIEAGAVITAIGQQPDFRNYLEEIPFDITPRNLITTIPQSTRTSVPDIFAGGDAVTGPATVVEAIGAGKRAAVEIDHYLSGLGGTPSCVVPRKRGKIPFVPIHASEKIAIRREPMLFTDPAERKGNFGPVELPLTELQAQKEARRCLRCDVCIRCGACEKVCRESMLIKALDFREISETEQILSDYDRAKERCIACGACVLACPTKAMELVEESGKREIRLCGIILNQLDVIKCESCGEPFAPQRLLEYVVNRSDEVMAEYVSRRLCPKCARSVKARDFAAALKET